MMKLGSKGILTLHFVVLPPSPLLQHFWIMSHCNYCSLLCDFSVNNLLGHFKFGFGLIMTVERKITVNTLGVFHEVCLSSYLCTFLQIVLHKKMKTLHLTVHFGMSKFSSHICYPLILLLICICMSVYMIWPESSQRMLHKHCRRIKFSGENFPVILFELICFY